MSYKFTAVPPAEHLNAIVKNFFVIEFDEDIIHTDYLLPDGLPSFFLFKPVNPILQKFALKTLGKDIWFSEIPFYL